MFFKPQLRSQVANGLRTRYFPRSRVGHGLIVLGPWVSVVLLLGLYWLVNSQRMLHPGVVVDLPSVAFTEGVPSGMIAVVLSVPGGGASREHQEIIFFDDERFIVGGAGQLPALKQAMAMRLKQHPDASLIIQADRRILHGTIVDLISAARDVGVRRVDLASKP